MDETADLENTGFLLQRLQELKNWQRQQEENLLKEQEFKEWAKREEDMKKHDYIK